MNTHIHSAEMDGYIFHMKASGFKKNELTCFDFIVEA